MKLKCIKVKDGHHFEVGQSYKYKYYPKGKNAIFGGYYHWVFEGNIKDDYGYGFNTRPDSEHYIGTYFDIEGIQLIKEPPQPF